jgi:hypothetical protein
MRTFDNQFPKEWAPEPALLAWLQTHGWKDTSWGNDMCPSFESPDGQYRLWIDHVLLDSRDMMGPRYALVLMTDHDDRSRDLAMWDCEETTVCIERLTYLGPLNHNDTVECRCCGQSFVAGDTIPVEQARIVRDTSILVLQMAEALSIVAEALKKSSCFHTGDNDGCQKIKTALDAARKAGWVK